MAKNIYRLKFSRTFWDVVGYKKALKEKAKLERKGYKVTIKKMGLK